MTTSSLTNEMDQGKLKFSIYEASKIEMDVGTGPPIILKTEN